MWMDTCERFIASCVTSGPRKGTVLSSCPDQWMYLNFVYCGVFSLQNSRICTRAFHIYYEVLLQQQSMCRLCYLKRPILTYSALPDYLRALPGKLIIGRVAVVTDILCRIWPWRVIGPQEQSATRKACQYLSHNMANRNAFLTTLLQIFVL